MKLHLLTLEIYYTVLTLSFYEDLWSFTKISCQKKRLWFALIHFFITGAFLFKIFKKIFNRLAPCAPLGGSQYRPNFGLQYLGNGKRKHYLLQTFFKEYSTSFLMVCRLIDFALVVLKLLMFKVCVTIGISKIEFFNFSGIERV